MTRSEIQQTLRANHQSFLDLVKGLSEAQFNQAPDGKWTPGQHLEHIQRAVAPLAKGVGLPKFVLKWVFGKANRPSKTYEGLVQKYKNKIAAGGQASGRFIPPAVGWNQRDALLLQLPKTVQLLAKRLEKFSEEDLDAYIAPHPLLGKLTLREMMYFTVYHVQHHEGLIQRDTVSN